MVRVLQKNFNKLLDFTSGFILRVFCYLEVGQMMPRKVRSHRRNLQRCRRTEETENGLTSRSRNRTDIFLLKWNDQYN